jgi:gamma-glutamyltranspeptidase/glutathione hydrolase
MDRRRFAANGRAFAIATPHHAATTAGMQAFDAGGNAVDAAIAASAVLAVVYPHMCGVGGDFFALIADRSSSVALNGSGAAAQALDAATVTRTHGAMPAFGPLSITVPGAVAGWGTAVERFGRLPFAEAIKPAIQFAEAGIPVATSLGRAIQNHLDRLRQDTGLAATFLHDSEPLKEGETLRQPGLAQTLRSIAVDGADAFYRGALSARLIDGLKYAGSMLSPEDFSKHTTEVLSPLARPYRGLDVLVPPPNSQGFILEEILTAIERASIEPDHLGRQAAVIARLFLLASADRDRLSADPRRSPVPLGQLLGDAHISELVQRAQSEPAAGLAGHTASGDTVGIVAAEEGGRWVSINQSLYDAFGSGILDPSTGVLFHNRGSAFSLDASSPNRLEGGRRPAHTLMPVMVLDRGEPRIVSATMGRSAHAQIHAELLMAVIDQHRDAFTAVDRPRWLAGGLRAGSDVVAERRVPKPVLESFIAARLAIDPVGDWDEQVGHAQLIARTSDGTLHAGSDPRADGAALAR